MCGEKGGSPSAVAATEVKNRRTLRVSFQGGNKKISPSEGHKPRGKKGVRTGIKIYNEPAKPKRLVWIIQNPKDEGTSEDRLTENTLYRKLAGEATQKARVGVKQRDLERKKDRVTVLAGRERLEGSEGCFGLG